MFRTKRIVVLTLTCLAATLLAEVWAAGSAPQPTICERACWVARAPSCAISQEPGLTRAVIHHTAGASDYNTTSLDESKAKVRAIQNYHMDTNGWCDVGYHFLTDKLGNNFEGRAGSMTSFPRGAHDGVNAQSFGFNMMGYYHTPYNQVPTPEGRSSNYDVIAWRMLNGYSPYGAGSYGGKSVGYLCGHRDVGATACPGDLLYAYIGADVNAGEARDQVNARITGGGGTPTPTPTPDPNNVIVDNDQGAPAYTETGTWATSASTGYNGGTYRYATAAQANTATWTADLAQAGTYEVSVFYRAGTNRTTSTKYDLAGQTIYINQQINDLVWVALGAFSLSAGSNTVVLDAAGSSGGGTVVIADAVKFTLTTAPTPTPSPTPSATPTPTPAPPAAPSNLTATAISKNRIDLSWVDNANNEDNFVVERRKGAGAYSVIITLPADTISYSDTTVAKNSTYTYRVKATNGGGSSAYSNEASATTPRL